MNAKLRALLAKKQEAATKAREILATADKAGRDLTDEEKTESDKLMAQIKDLDAKIERERNLEAAEASLAGVEISDSATDPEPAVLRDPKHGFKNYGEFCGAVRRAGRRSGAVVDERLAIVAAAPSTYGSEASGTDGGFLVPPEFSSEINRLMLDEGSLLEKTDQVPIDGNSIVFPKDETTPWGADGVRAYWQNEAAAATQTKPKITPSQQRLHKLLALVPVTDELLDDTSALSAYLAQKTATSINWKVNDALLNGTGSGQPAGIASANALVQVSKDSGQATLTLTATNVANMFARMPAAYLNDAEWFINNDVLPSLLTMTLGNYPIYTPPNVGITGSPAGLLFGRPINITQHCASFTSKGDIYFINWKQYRTIVKRGAGIKTDVSMHLYFDADATAFRATFRVDGQPKIQNAITPNKGSNNLSPYVVLQAR